MPAATASPARIAANRRNAQKSTGPRTEEGKARSRRNALKHGMAGKGVALPIEDERAVAERFLGLQEELAPSTILGRYFAHEIALATVRTQRAVRQESAHLAHKIRHAANAFDEARLADAEYQLGYIGCEPVTHRRRLLSSPQGVDLLIQSFRELHRDLRLNRERWDYVREQVMEAYLGRRATEIPAPRSRALSQALQGNLDLLDPDDRAAIEAAPSKFEGARALMLDFLDAQVTDLLRRRETFDFEAIERDRAEAAERALFDAGKDALLARRYEAAAKRDLYRALAEFRAVEAAAFASPDDEDDHAPGDDAPPEEVALGDARPAPAPEPDTDSEPTQPRPGRPNSIPAVKLTSALGSSRPIGCDAAQAPAAVPGRPAVEPATGSSRASDRPIPPRRPS